VASPKIFISSTFEDLKIIREVIDEFVKGLGYDPVRFEDGDIPFDCHQSLDASCYDEVRVADILILIIGKRYGSQASFQCSEAGDVISVTRNEYRVALNHGIPIHTFIEKSTLDEYNTYLKNQSSTFNFSCLENVHQVNFIKELFNQKTNAHFIKEYSKLSDIRDFLKKQWAGLFRNYLANARKYEERLKTATKINAYKFFFFRRNIGISTKELSSRSGISEKRLREFEDAGKGLINYNDIEKFASCSLDELQRIAAALNCGVSNLKAGLPDDFLSQMILYYRRYKGKKPTKASSDLGKSLFKTRVVLLDFDGTLTRSNNDHTTWEEIWVRLGYGVNECAEFHRKFTNGEITHLEWCELTAKKFRAKHLTKVDVDKVADGIFLLPGVEETLQVLEKNNIKIYVVSGSIKYIINRVLGDHRNYFAEIKANEFKFDSGGLFTEIIGTKYDFEGKADFIKQVIVENGIEPYEALFVGNSSNDTWAHESGAVTLCINPKMVDPNNTIEWTHCIRASNNFTDILKYVTL
jgi:HAD superfamily phosphoserine phosphatase-like hydrolase